MPSAVLRCHQRERRHPTWPRSVPSLLLSLLYVLVSLQSPRVVEAQLVPLRSTPILGTTYIEQLSYDPVNQTLYIVDYGQNNIAQASSVPLATPWACTVLAGSRLGLPGTPGTIPEVAPESAFFSRPTGVAGWAPGPLAERGSAAARWIGLWICDFGNHAIRYINFLRGSNVSLVAGLPTGNNGVTDGIGTGATLTFPGNIVWARLCTDGASPTGGSDPTWTSSAFYWSDREAHCIRRGVPLHGRTLAAVEPGDGDSLEDMVLNVTTFAGWCGHDGRAVGQVLQRPTFYYPWGVAFYQPFVLPSSTMNVTTALATIAALFVADMQNLRLAMVTPTDPPGNRFLTVVTSVASGTIVGLTVGRASLWAPSSLRGSLEMFVGTSTAAFMNLSFTLEFNVTSSSLVVAPGSSINSLLTASDIPFTGNLATVRYTPNSSYSGTLVVFSGSTSTGSGTVLQFYCCLGEVYSEFPADGSACRPLSVPVVRTRTPTLSAPTRRTGSAVWSVTARTGSISRSTRITAATGSLLWTRSHVTRMRDRARSSRTVTQLQLMARRSITSVWPLSARNGSSNGSFVPQASLLSGITAAQKVMVTSTAAAGITTAVMAASGGSKAAVPGRALAVRRCSVVGPSVAVADDPEQFLSFGLALGSGDDGAARGALIMTSCLRLAFVAASIVVMMVRPLSISSLPAVGIVTAVSINYFTPNVVGLATAVFSASSSDAVTVACAVVALVAEALMIIVITAAVAQRGGTAIRALGREYVVPIRCRRRWYFRIAALEDLAAAVLIAVCSNLSPTTVEVCFRVGWALLLITVLHSGYVIVLRPYREKLDSAVSIFLALVNAAFALLCCVVPRGEQGDNLVSTALTVVTACFYVSLVGCVVVSVWGACRTKREASVHDPSNHRGNKPP